MSVHVPEYRIYGTQPHLRLPLIDFMVSGLRQRGCRIIYCSPADKAPFKITFETLSGERMGIVAYAFLATFTPTKNRPADEWTFQVKYGSKTISEEHEIWQDPLGLYTTLLIGIDPDTGFFVAADPVLNNPTKFFIRKEFKQSHVDSINSHSWFSWERISRKRSHESFEVLVGGKQDRFLDLVHFEREALGEDQGHRMLLAERFTGRDSLPPSLEVNEHAQLISASRIHTLAEEFELTESEVLDLITETPRMKMAVRGGVAELHLKRQLIEVPGVTECERLTGEGQPDIALRYRGSRPILLECKNSLRKTTANGLARVDFQKTRASKSDPCSRYYSATDFDVLAACIHAVTEKWTFKFHDTRSMVEHKKCVGKLDNNVKLDQDWCEQAEVVLKKVAIA